jgi:hypothetical protein
LLRNAFTTREALLSGRDDSIDAMASPVLKLEAVS